jgi:outer membrane protein OmpA-like peptidoglycan-associated protein
LHPAYHGRPRAQNWPAAAWLLCTVLAVYGCTGVAPPRNPAPAAAQAQPNLATALAIERQWLNSWFRGTPVLIGQRSDGALTIEVPRDHCFAPGRSTLKPALAVVLDKVAESLRRRPQARVAVLAAPDDRSRTVPLAPLARQRALEVRQHLLGRGVPSSRIAEPSATAAAAVQLRIGGTAP